MASRADADRRAQERSAKTTRGGTAGSVEAGGSLARAEDAVGSMMGENDGVLSRPRPFLLQRTLIHQHTNRYTLQTPLMIPNVASIACNINTARCRFLPDGHLVGCCTSSRNTSRWYQVRLACSPSAHLSWRPNRGPSCSALYSPSYFSSSYPRQHSPHRPEQNPSSWAILRPGSTSSSNRP